MNHPGAYIPREQAIAAAAQILYDAVAERASRTPREAAVAAWYPGHPLGTVEAIETQIIRRRAEDPATASLPAPRAAA